MYFVFLGISFNYNKNSDYYEPKKQWYTIWIYFGKNKDFVIQWRLCDRLRIRYHNYKQNKSFWFYRDKKTFEGQEYIRKINYGS